MAGSERRGAVGGRIPVVVLAGFLGSGKTTLLNHLLRRARGTRIGAVVNDFGSIEIDAMAVSGQVDSMVSLSDGCLCCAVDTSDMDEVLEVLARPSAGMDVIVIEASGVAEPETLIRMVLASGSPHIVYGGLVEVVDAAEFEAVRERHPELERHVGAADLLVLNKADRVPAERQEALRAELERLAPGTPVVPATFGRVDPQLLFDRVHRARPPVEQLSFDTLLYGDEEGEGGSAGEARGRDGADHAQHLHAAYEAVEFTAAEPMDPRRFLDFLDSRPEGLYRMKGYVDFGAADPDNVYEMHAVGGFLRFAPERRPRSQERRTDLVMIGSGVDGAALREGLRACVAGSDTDADTDTDTNVHADAGAPDERAMWGVLRYVAHAPEGDGDRAGHDAAEAPEGGAEPGTDGTGTAGSGPYGTRDADGAPDPYDPYDTCDPDDRYEPHQSYAASRIDDPYGYGEDPYDDTRAPVHPAVSGSGSGSAAPGSDSAAPGSGPQP
ncbi:GTP-binding protein [Streptomyces albus subsp. chlorinus]